MSRSRILKTLQFLGRKHIMKIVFVILILSLFFILPTFAQDATTHTSTLDDLQAFLGKLIGIFSWLWIFLAVLAGKLMTNEFVYGSFMHLDVYLWKVRNIMKNFANFALIFMILVGIVKSTLKLEKAPNPKDLVVKALLAGVLIQASWFIIGACIDLSTIATQAVAAFPAKFIWADQLIQNTTKEGKKMYARQYSYTTIDGKTIGSRKDLSDTNNSCSLSTDEFMPTYDSVSWPLMYIGFSALKVQQYMDAESLSSTQKWWALIINFLLKFVILWFFTFVLLLLCIANLIRILCLWLLVLGAPIFILVGIFDWKLWGDKWIGKYLNVKTFVDLIFKPVIFAAFLGLTLIFVSSMQSLMIGSKTTINNINWISINLTGGQSTIEVAWLSTFSVNDNIFKDIGGEGDAKSLFADLIIFFMTLFLLRFLLRASIVNENSPIGSAMGTLMGHMEGIMKALPIVPTGAGGMSFNNAKAFKQGQMKKMLEGTWIDIRGWKITLDKTGQDYLNNDLYPKQWQSWHTEKLRATRTWDEFFDTSKTIGDKLDGWLSLITGEWWKILEEKLKKWALEVWSYKLPWNEKQDPNYWTNPDNLKALHDIMKAKDISIRDSRQNTTTTPHKDNIFWWT